MRIGLSLRKECYSFDVVSKQRTIVETTSEANSYQVVRCMVVCRNMSEVVQSKDSEPTTPAIIDNLLLVITNQITINLFKCCFYYQINI